MSPNNKHNVSEKELDNLLGQAFLNLDFNNPKNQELMESISSQVLPTHPLNPGVFNKSFITKLISIITVIILSVTIYITFFNTKSTHEVTPTATIPSKKQDQPTVNSNEPNKLTELPLKDNDSPTDKTITPTKAILQEQQDTKATTQVEIQKHAPLKHDPNSEQIITGSEDSNYVFPVLTEKQIKANEKEKKIMTELLLKQSKSRYRLISPPGSGSLFSNINDTTAMFYIQDAEVTNLEYRTFLFDLLINNRKKDFLIAKPYQSLWINASGTSTYNRLKDSYFADKKFDYHPVVNISKEGAELYCQWLSELSKKGYANVKARLPYENEWMFAASGGMHGSYPWGSNQVQNAKGCFLANFNITKLKDKLTPGTECHYKAYANAHTTAGYALGDSSLLVYAYSYNPNEFGLYCMSGNVSEMVYSNASKKIKAKGGNWNSDFEHCKINSDDEFKENVKASPMIGFRPVFRIDQSRNIGSTDRENPTTGLPTLTTDEITANQKEKHKMVSALSKFDKNKYALLPTGSCLYRNKMVSSQSFYMANTEVTNLEYRTFLIDLLIQGRTNDYLTAKPDQVQWTKKFSYAYNEPMKDLYFSHPAYNDYPVVNISRKGAQMYCDWLTIETNKVLKATHKPLINDLRIPSDYEWAYAASNGKNYAKYANGFEFLRDRKGLYMMNYTCETMEDCRYDTVMKLYIPVAKKHKFMDDGGFHMVTTKSYVPNSYGIYCMAGNVAEMITPIEGKSNATKGGSWFSCDHFLEIDAEDEYPDDLNGSPLIGFRPVTTALSVK